MTAGRSAGRARRTLAGVIAVLGFAALGACSLAIDLDPLTDGACPAGEKACDDACVPVTDPNHGCASPGCAPCTLPHAGALCTPAGTCAIDACIGAYLDCDGDPTNGCEIDSSHDPNHCGSCTAVPCATPNGAPACAAGHCSTGSCDKGYGDCNGATSDGCETDELTDSQNCGECKTVCGTGETCQMGKCM